MKKFFAALAAVVLSLGLAFAQNYGKAKNVILMIPDGMSVESLTMARWMEDDFSFVLDQMATGLVRTNNSNTPIADSAPAATAMATGIKSQSPYIATYPGVQGNMPGALPFDPAKANMPLATVLEAANRLGKSTGLISTSNIQHATPAGFSSHYPNRSAYEILGEQQVYQNMTVVLGAGSDFLNNRKDGENLIEVLKKKGYDYVTTTDQMKASKANKLWGMFAGNSLAYDIDRDPAVEPSLAEMTEKALSILSKNKSGFFIMIEGSEVDWANHANDPVGCISDIRAFDKAVEVAKKFADSHADTVIIIAADHGTGGLTFGESGIASGYDKTPLEQFTRYIKNAKKTPGAAAKLLNDSRSNAADIMKSVYGITDLTKAELDSITSAKYPEDAMSDILAKRCHIGYTTTGHVGGDIALYCYTTGKVKPLTGTVFNSDIGTYIASVIGADLDKLTKQLYNEAEGAAKKIGATMSIDLSNKENPVLLMSKKGKTFMFPVNKNIAIFNGLEKELDGLVVYNGEKFYIPQSAINLVK